ncbi:MAG: type I-E CRISPR-associated protein Cse1/CasA [Dehalococcoidia bacterium]|nr:type I-E CRISPR-associated protein Cse1/CasA [Dehalococcoidia bacterium]
MHNLLTEPLLGVRRTDGGSHEVSLPKVLAGLVSGQVDSFTGMMPHQRHAWFAFLVQLSAIALHRAQRDAMSEEPGEWTALLRGLTRAWPDDEPWRLVVEDVKQPAFMQPPVPEGALDDRNWKRVRLPAEIDILVTTKNHDVKRNRIAIARPEHWVYALTTLQTMQGYSGGGGRLHGISRMNSGVGNRPYVALAHSPSWGVRFRRDTAALLRGRQRILQDYDLFQEEDGLALLWLESWDGEEQLSIRNLDPYYIEVCRRVRLAQDESGILGLRTNAKERIAGTKQIKGNTGDPWTPVSVPKKGTATALTVNKSGFTYKRLHEVLLGSDYKPGLCLEAQPEDGAGDVLLLAWAFARDGVGKTGGQHEKTVPVPAKVRHLLLDPSQRSWLGERARARVREAHDCKSRVLRPALRYLLQGGPDSDRLDRKDTRDRPFSDRFDPRVDDIFFQELWKSVDLDEDEARRRWVKQLDDIGWRILKEAERSAPVPQARRARAVAVAEIHYRRLRRKTFSDIFEGETRT